MDESVSDTETNETWVQRPTFKHNTVLRQSAYIISVISEKNFKLQGADELAYGIYIKQQPFDGTANFETIALLGIPMLHVTSFFEENNDLLDELKLHPKLSFIDDIHQITCAYTCDILKKFKTFFETVESNYLLLLNIEPKGEGKYKRLYPYPRITLPGGTMEECDSGDFLQCALREFKEETHINLTDNYQVISQKRIVKDIRKRKGKRLFNIFESTKPSKVISMFFVIRMKD